MNYALELIAMPEEADLLVKTANRDKRIFEHRKESLNILALSSAETAAEQQQELSTAQAELTTANTIIDGLPDGPKKEEEITKKLALELKIRKINEGADKTGTIALIEQQYDADLLERQIAAIDGFITLVNQRKAAL